MRGFLLSAYMLSWGFYLLPLDSVAAGGEIEIYAYRGYSNPRSEKLLLIGEVISRSHLMGERQKVMGFDTREMILTARLFSDEGLRLNDTVLVIEKDPDHKRFKNGYIVAEAEIISIFETSFQGPMLKARGNLSMVKKRHYIAVPDRRQDREKAYAHFKTAERYERMGDLSAAYAEYRRSLEADHDRPETYVSLAQNSLKNGRQKEALSYIDEAWRRRRNFREANEYLKLGGLYLNIHLEDMVSRNDTAARRLRELLHLKREINLYRDGLADFRTSFSKQTLEMLRKKGIPDYDFNYYNGILYENIWHILREHPLGRVLGWLEKSDRELLYEPIRLPYRESQKSEPRTIWDQAFFHAAVYHYELAHELNGLDTRAAYRLALVAAGILRESPSRSVERLYTAMLQHYGQEFLKVPGSDQQMARVRNLLNTFIQR